MEFDIVDSIGVFDIPITFFNLFNLDFYIIFHLTIKINIFLNQSYFNNHIRF